MTKHQTVKLKQPKPKSQNSNNNSSNKKLITKQQQALAQGDNNEENRRSTEDDVSVESTRTDTISTNTTEANKIANLPEEGIIPPPPPKEKVECLHPFVYWAQSQTHISLRVELTQIESLNVDIINNERDLIFSAKGKGAQGLQNYQFSIEFYSDVEKKFDCHKIERHVLILIKKAKEQVSWPRLTRQQIRLPWLRVDFDRYAGEDSEDNSSDEHVDSDDEVNQEQRFYDQLNQHQVNKLNKQEIKHHHTSSANTATTNKSWSESLDNIFNKRNNNFDIFNPFNKKIDNNYNSKNKEAAASANMKHDYRKETVTVDNSKNSAKQLNYKKTYLFLYNLVMFIMFLKVYIVLLIKFSNGTMDDEILQGAAFIIRMLTYTQLLETLHPILGLVPGGPLNPFFQVFGRILVNLFLVEPAIRLNSAPYAHYLFIVWSSIEIIRYPFYALRVFKVNIYPITWCRYSLFLPLYPMGGFFETKVVLATISHYDKTGEYNLSLPNQANISMSLPFFLRIYVFLLLFPFIGYLMNYMWKQRSKQLKQKVD